MEYSTGCRAAARQAARDVEWSKARGAARDAGRGRAWWAAYDTAYDAARGKAWQAARDAILALIAYDDCAYMLDSEPGELAILAAFGDPRAVLILPACEILHSLKEIA